MACCLCVLAATVLPLPAGSFGEVFRGIWRGTEVAVKLLLEQDLNPENTDDFCNEIALLSRLRHPNGQHHSFSQSC